MYNLKQFLTESHKQIDFIDDNLRRYKEVLIEGEEMINSIKGQYNDVLLKMVEIMAPEFSDPELAKVANLLHKRELDLLDDKMRLEAVKGKQRLDAIEQDAEYQQREILTDPKTGDYVVELNQMKSGYLKFSQEFTSYQRHLRDFEHLINVHYGTKDYPHKGIWKFFNSKHLKNWKTGDELCEKFGFDSFPPLREKYLSMKEQNENLRNAVKHYTDKIQYIENLVSEKNNLEERLPQLKAIYKQKLAKELELFLKATSKESLADFFAAYEGMAKLSKMQQGLMHQLIYLKDFHEKIHREKADWEGKKERLSRERKRYKSNPYKYQDRTWPKHKFEKRFRRNTEWTEKRFGKYKKTQQLVGSYRDYDNVNDSVTTVFWWSEFTAGQKVDGSFSPSINEYYENHTHDEDLFEEDSFQGRGTSFRDDS